MTHKQQAEVSSTMLLANQMAACARRQGLHEARVIVIRACKDSAEAARLSALIEAAANAIEDPVDAPTEMAREQAGSHYTIDDRNADALHAPAPITARCKPIRMDAEEEPERIDLSDESEDISNRMECHAHPGARVWIQLGWPLCEYGCRNDLRVR